jgi:hypothetical protein
MSAQHLSKTVRLVLTTALVASSMTGCLSSNNHPQVSVAGSSIVNLTGAQKTLVLNTYQSAVIAASAAQSLNPSLTPGIAGADAASAKFSQLTAVLNADLQVKTCKIQSMDQSFKITSSNCPISLDDETPSSTQSSPFSIQYNVTDSAYRSITDVDSFQISGTMGMLQTAATNAVQFTLQGTGSLHSQQHGQLGVTMSQTEIFVGQSTTGPGTESFQSTTDIQFPQFIAELKETGTDGVNAYFLNGVQLTADEISNYISPAFTDNQDGGSLLGRDSFFY